MFILVEVTHRATVAIQLLTSVTTALGHDLVHKHDPYLE